MKTKQRKKVERCCSIAPSSKFCPVHSKVKMSFMLKNGCKHLKQQNAFGKLVNPVRYSYLTLNNKSIAEIVSKMKSKLTESFPELTAASNLVIFYDKKNEVDRFRV